jgi:hypothetical protein
MDTAPLVATLTSTLAIGLTIVLLRLMRQDRQRSEARVLALVTLAANPARAAFDAPPVRLERRAAAGRIEPAAQKPLRRAAAVDAPAIETPELFEPAVPRAASHLLYIGIGAAIMVTLIAIGFRWSLSSAQAPTTETSAAVTAPAAAAQPLSLVSLRHEQSSDGTLVISGVVANPAGSVTRDRIFAAAALVGAGGELIATARAPLDFTSLAAGEESPFVVRISGAGNVARYRIGFRDAAGNAVAHIDRR